MKDENAMDDLRVGVLAESLPILFKSEPVIQIPVKWRNAVGELKGDLNIAMADAKSVDNSIKSLDLNISLPLNVIGELAKQIRLSEGNSREAAQIKAETRRSQNLRMWVNNSIYLSLMKIRGHCKFTMDREK